MLFCQVLFGLFTLASATPFIAYPYANNTNTSTSANTTNLPGHYLPESITSRTFFNGTCTPETLRIRKEWRSLTHTEKTAFIDAELCLMSLPNKTSLPGATNRFDDFQAAHQQGTNTTYGDVIHYTGQFLPWHRWQLHAFETALKTECGFNGTLPWWDEALDAASGNFFQSDMWTDLYFGGNGSSPSSCVTSGPFANRTLHIGPLEETTNYCFARSFNQTKGLSYGVRSHIDDCYAYGSDSFSDFYSCMAYYPHIAGHQAVGGVMTDVDSSPGDPVFYLHHNYLDRVYWEWQQIDPVGRLDLIEGNTTVTEPEGGWVALEKETEMSMWGVVEEVKIGEVLNAQGGYLCYAFEY